MQTEAEKHGCQVIYDENDIEQTFRQWQGHGYHEPFHLGSATVELLDAGHVLGSAMARFTRDGRTVIFTGDLGNTPEPLLNDTESPEGANYIIMESVYGDRVHEGREERVERLRAAVEGARARHGTLLIPSFSLERTQVLLYELNAMIEGKTMQPISIYLDAPLAIRVTEIFKRYIDYMNPAVRELTEAGDDPFVFPGLSITRNTGESRAIHNADDPKVIIAGAGMSSGGRIRAHEKQYLPDKKAAVLFVGYQSPGSLGRRIQEGASQVEIDGDKVRVHAQIDTLSGFSGHADRDQLLNFVEDAGEKITRVFVTMGEPKASAFLAQRIRDFLDVDAVVPEAGQSFDIEW
jgi:metallo-beta-lactamase family protein